MRAGLFDALPQVFALEISSTDGLSKVTLVLVLKNENVDLVSNFCRHETGGCIHTI